MKRVFAFLTVLGLAASALAAEIGKPAPDFTATDINGKTIKLSDYKDKVVVLESYNQDCPFCHNHFQTGAMQELQRELTGKGVVAAGKFCLTQIPQPPGRGRSEDRMGAAKDKGDRMAG